MGRQYLYVVDPVTFEGEITFSEGIPVDRSLDLTIFASDTLLKPGDTFKYRQYDEYKATVGTIRNLRFSKDEPNLTTPEELKDHCNKRLIEPEVEPKIIIITPSHEATPVTIKEIGCLNNWRRSDGVVTSEFTPRYVDIPYMDARYADKDLIVINHKKPEPVEVLSPQRGNSNPWETKGRGV